MDVNERHIKVLNLLKHLRGQQSLFKKINVDNKAPTYVNFRLPVKLLLLLENQSLKVSL
jgi:hypothetical protein